MKKSYRAVLVWLAVVLLLNASAFIENIFDGNRSGNMPSYDDAMRTREYHVDITVGEDNSYLVEETLDVEFQQARHGIFRYIPMKDTSRYIDKKGEEQQIPYYAKIDFTEANTAVHVSEESGNKVFRLGREDETAYGDNTYRLTYRVTPQVQDKNYSSAYYNVFPNMWQNDIPAGSSFTITFPKDFPKENLKFYAGRYGSTQDGESVLKLAWDGRTVSGVLQQDLKIGEGITFFAQMEEGYFVKVHTLDYVGVILLVLTIVILGIVVCLFLLFGRDEPMYPSIQYQPPEELDSAAVGYIIDGTVEDRDVLSLLIFWADKGYMRIIEREDEDLVFEKLADLPGEAPGYEKTMFRKLFGKKDSVSVKSLQYKFQPAICAVKAQIKNRFCGKNGIYTGTSKAARVVAAVLSLVPFAAFVGTIANISPVSAFQGTISVLSVIMLLIGVIIVDYTIDNWYSKKRNDRVSLVISGVGICFTGIAIFTGSYLVRVWKKEVFSFLPTFLAVFVSTVIMVLLTGFMKKRTHQSMEWMGKLVGLRDFIETAELERLQVLAKENPEWFYHVLPYTYVFGLSDVFARRLEGLAIPGPDWYVPVNRGNTFWDYYVFHHMFMRNMNYASRTMTQAPPMEVASSGSHSGSAGGFGGGSSGGGFSGGGFGGGGGGSW